MLFWNKKIRKVNNLIGGGGVYIITASPDTAKGGEKIMGIKISFELLHNCSIVGKQKS